MHCALQGNKISSGSNASYRKIVVALLVVAAGHEAKKKVRFDNYHKVSSCICS